MIQMTRNRRNDADAIEQARDELVAAHRRGTPDAELVDEMRTLAAAYADFDVMYRDAVARRQAKALIERAQRFS